ncbi:hypothetical protein D5086_029487 [Populus alba]|uniref:Uncharacterized protein n=1 Tax=Populus alba TaxID=43335 RepID=A0ACC4ATQ1_POPAL
MLVYKVPSKTLDSGNMDVFDSFSIVEVTRQKQDACYVSLKGHDAQIVHQELVVVNSQPTSSLPQPLLVNDTGPKPLGDHISQPVGTIFGSLDSIKRGKRLKPPQHGHVLQAAESTPVVHSDPTEVASKAPSQSQQALYSIDDNIITLSDDSLGSDSNGIDIRITQHNYLTRSKGLPPNHGLPLNKSRRKNCKNYFVARVIIPPVWFSLFPYFFLLVNSDMVAG